MDAREIIGDEITVGFDVDIPTSEIVGNILAALKEAGMAVVPVEPSGHAARCGAVQLRDDRLYAEEKAAACYRTMLAATQEQEEG